MTKLVSNDKMSILCDFSYELLSNYMIKELTWDSGFFKKKIGYLKIPDKPPFSLQKAIENARKQRYQYISCKITRQDASLIAALEEAGFYLADIGVTFESGTKEFLCRCFRDDYKVSDNDQFNTLPLIPSHRWRGSKVVSSAVSGKYGGNDNPLYPPLLRGNNDRSACKKNYKIQAATAEDIPDLKKLVKPLFRESRFYSDLFFSKKDADNLYQAWIENSVKGDAADVVLYLSHTGFVTCKKTGRKSGSIVLVGVKRDARGKGVGTALIKEAMKWFGKENIELVTVRTQLKNVKAMNFYAGLGFFVRGYDLMFGRIL